MDQILNKENTGINLPANPIKNGVPTNSVLKKPLGNLDNVMHQTPGITPFKSTSLKLEGSIAKLSLRKAPKQNVVSRDREEVRYKTNSCFLGAYVLNCEYRVVNLFNYTDFPNEKCLKNCSKPVTETWSENQEGYEGLLDQLYLDLRTLENNLENRCLPPLDFTDLPYIYNTENMEPAEPEYLLNLYPPLPNLEGIDVLF
uniref:LD16810p n=1 Tax=Drosophila melanogaster TaxID=7227 RepID=Q24454_DROME|nr:pimples, isoform B [Drosophila melanogaster]NP_476678.1 pimples, isoform A [Drosophila melanogaster]ACL89013.1 pim-PA [synthetic construct]AAF52925.1 pimples, isoform A [Drosophila melanogaster]AAL28775.1 LD16810p [Drosophila melanogaster]AGB92869.1 pimples, isoform B [Drosophila melanogaster]CAA63811.1 pimples [Drosophila melanogaster]|eukprot:NP_001260334.1 pimples, isoform B [Drosophila melanogaster]